MGCYRREDLCVEAIKLNDAAVRAYELKAQILIAAMLFGIAAFNTLLSNFGGVAIGESTSPKVTLALMLTTLFALGWVVAPVRPISSGDMSQVLFCHERRTPEDVILALSGVDPLSELAAELAAIERVRQVKKKRNDIAMSLLGICFALQAVRLLSGLPL